MNGLSHRISSSSQQQNPDFFHNQVKGMGLQGSVKTLGSSANPELAAWYEDAYAYYQSVQSGQEPQPESSAWNEFLTQMQWAYGQLMAGPSSGWQPEELAGGNGSGSAPSASDPFGAMVGTDGAWVHTEASAYVGFLGNQTRHFWSNDITIDVASMAAQVEVVKSMDESSAPPEEVLKVRIYDAATGTEDIYWIHDYADAQIEINVPDPDQVNDGTGENPAIITVGEFKAASTQELAPQSSVAGETLEDRENAYLYEGRMGQVIEFSPEGSGESGEVETHVVYGDSAIYTRPTDEVAVRTGIDGIIEIEITHLDGSIDLFEIQEGYQIQLFAREQTLNIDDIPYEDLEEIPETYSEVLTINGAEGSASGSEAYPEDTQPDRVEEGTAIFNSSQVVSLHNVYEGDTEQFEIITGGTVEIIAYNYEDKINLFLEPDGSYRIEIYNPEFSERRIYHVEGPPSQISLQGFLPDKVNVFRETVNGANSNVRGVVKIYNFLDGATNSAETEELEALAIVQVGAANAAQPSEAIAETAEEEDTAAQWPAGNISNQIKVTNHSANEALELIRLVEQAVASGQNGDWNAVTAYVNDLKGKAGNDVIRKFITALYQAVGNDMEVLREVLDFLPESVRRAMMAAVIKKENELTESHNGDLFNSQGAWDQLSVSLNDDEED